MEVVNHTTKMKAVLNFKPSGWFGKDLHKVEGYLFDKEYVLVCLVIVCFHPKYFG